MVVTTFAEMTLLPRTSRPEDITVLPVRCSLQLKERGPHLQMRRLIWVSCTANKK